MLTVAVTQKTVVEIPQSFIEVNKDLSLNELVDKWLERAKNVSWDTSAVTYKEDAA